MAICQMAAALGPAVAGSILSLRLGVALHESGPTAADRRDSATDGSVDKWPPPNRPGTEYWCCKDNSLESRVKSNTVEHG